MSDASRPLSDLPAAEKAARAGSFGSAAEHYARFRPGPSPDAVAWILPAGAAQVVDLGAGTGALSRVLVRKGIDVIAVEPDDRMRAVLTEQLPQVDARAGRGDDMPIDDASVDAVIASSSWHWMDVEPTLAEVARVLRPGGTLGAVWSGPDPDGELIVAAQELLAGSGSGDGPGGGAPSGQFASFLQTDAAREVPVLRIPEGSRFEQPEHESFTWNVPMTADSLIGLLGTMSFILLMADEQRDRVLGEARRLLDEVMGVSGDATIDMEFRADAYRSRLAR